GTLLEAVSWHCPFAITVLRDAIDAGFVELIGSCYGQNIMRFFGAEYNLKQLNEELRLFELVLGVSPSRVKVFWPPERVWDRRSKLLGAIRRRPGKSQWRLERGRTRPLFGLHPLAFQKSVDSTCEAIGLDGCKPAGKPPKNRCWNFFGTCPRIRCRRRLREM